MSTVSYSLRFFYPKLSRILPKAPVSKSPFLPSKPSLLFFSPIYFQRLPKSPLSEPVKAQQQQREADVDISVLPPKLQEIIALFQSVSEPKAKYQQLLHYGAQLPPLDLRFKTDDHRVRGCVSQVWVRAFRDPDDPTAVRFEADSDSALTKGLAALLVFGLSGSPAPIIAAVPPGFVRLLGLQQSLTPSRNNGFLNMLKLMQQKALQLYSQSVSEPKAKYQQLLHYGAQLPPLDLRFKTDDHRVRGCVSQVWVRAFRDPDDPTAVRFEADSDSALTKGLAALLVFGLSGSPAPIIAAVPPGFVRLLGLQQSLTPSRNNGFLNMLKLMQQKALQLYSQVGHLEINGVSDSVGSNSGAQGGILGDKNSILGGETDETGKDSTFGEISSANGSGDSLPYGDLMVDGDGMDSADVVQKSSGGGIGGRRERIRERLERELSPVELEVEDISYQHAGHAGVRGNNDGETHFNVRVVSKEFEGKSLVKRHRLVYDLLQEELQSGLHALSIVAKTPSESQSG
ncbi:putative sufE-like protein 1, chloroplastic/mitochondrial [Cocos nucifera]|uniref:Putative sufE-like protein 1, chloroplastic/mitochondrial n=1 Tax=Cocos nucifera TaxID=13894 RepID=A0A8K0HV66_COCNU|nr:putative sufE-like protein 1, chloroplastic/mitochondrial [Cocos nucifera]